MKISCIIPVYNVSRYLCKCVDSVLNQTYRDFEIILVNDCSTDDSAAICKKYQSEYPDRIKFIDKPKNEGVDKARFTGLSLVLKENPNGGVMFIDSDDYIGAESLEKLAAEMDRTGCDVVKMRANRVFGPISRPHYSPIPAKVIEQPSLFDDYFISFFGVNLLDVMMWAKLYKVETIAKAELKPTGYRMGEDLMFNMRLFPHYRKYALIDYRGYNYRVGGLTSRFNPKLWDNLKLQYFEKKSFCKKYNYTKGIRTLNIELKNILLSTLCQRVVYLKDSDVELKAWLDEQFADKDLWRDINQMASSEADPVFTYIANTDTEQIIAIVRIRVKSTKLRRLIKKVLSLFFR